MERRRKRIFRGAIIATCILSGAVIPFIDYLVVIELFFLLIPLVLSLFISLAYLFGGLIFKRQSDKKALFLSSLIPIFIASQVLSVYTVDIVQRSRSERIIKEIELNQSLPSNRETLGIVIMSTGQSNAFQITYSRGFMIREIYSSSSRSWESIGWND